jgi:hypothetical protein
MRCDRCKRTKRDGAQRDNQTRVDNLDLARKE